MSTEGIASDNHVIAKPEGLWQSPGTMSVAAVQFGKWYQEIATACGLAMTPEGCGRFF